MSYLIRGILIGLLFGLPVGAVGAMTVQRTWSSGLKAGLLTGLGSSTADCLYAFAGAFGLTVISDFLLKYQPVIHFLGGGFLLLMGLLLLLQKAGDAAPQKKPAGGAGMFLSSFAVGMTNPAAVLAFVFAFSYFGIADVEKAVDGILLVCGVFLGTYCWWGALSAVTCAMKKKTAHFRFQHINKVFGGILCVFGAAVLLRIFL